jgi:hypothetical protein
MPLHMLRCSALMLRAASHRMRLAMRALGWLQMHMPVCCASVHTNLHGCTQAPG